MACTSASTAVPAPGSTPSNGDAATELGAGLAAAGHTLVYGGGHVGLMGTVADAALAGGGGWWASSPRRSASRAGPPGLTELVVTGSMHERKAIMCDRADGFVALPGGFGTFDELFETLTWLQLGTIAKPVVLLDVELAGAAYFEHLFRFFDTAVDAGLVKPAHRAMAQRATTVVGAIDIATGPAPASPSKWTDPSIR